MKAYVDDATRNGGDKCLELLDEMRHKDLRPDDRTLAVAMDACVKSGKTLDAERLLRGVDDRKKTRVMFNTLLSGYKREGRGEEAEGLIREMISLSEERGFGICSPDNVSFGLCIDAVSPCSKPGIYKHHLTFNCLNQTSGGPAKTVIVFLEPQVS